MRLDEPRGVAISNVRSYGLDSEQRANEIRCMPTSHVLNKINIVYYNSFAIIVGLSVKSFSTNYVKER